MDSDTDAKGKSHFDLSDVMSILDGEESSKVDEPVEEGKNSEPVPKISIVTLPAVIEKEELEVVPEARAPAVKAPEKIVVAETKNTQAKADNALSAKLLADMEQKNAEILKLKSDLMALQYKLNDKDYQLKEKDMNVHGMSTKLSDTLKKFETHQKQHNDLRRHHDDLQRQLETLQRQHDDLKVQLEGQQKQNADLQKQLENQQRQHDDLQKQYEVVKAELDEINEDKAKVMARAQAHKMKKSDGYNEADDTQAEPAEEDVASIFKRLTQDKPEEQGESQANTQDPEKPQENVPGFDRPQPPRKLKTAKLYDL